MGILDDAIREHLELKRRRGADPGEIERLEREALGPVRRPGYEASEMPLANEPAPERSQPDDQATELWPGAPDEPDFEDDDREFVREAEDWGASDIADTMLEPEVAPPIGPTPPSPYDGSSGRGLVQEDEFLEHDTVEHDVEVEYVEEPEHEDPHLRRRADPEPSELGYPEPAESGHPAPAESGHPAPPESGHPAPAEEDFSQQPEREDMLEETPEFLQDTPDHDRLWFEQRPPRDFDLDG